MNPRPNAFQRLLHRLIVLPQVIAFIAPRVHRLDLAVLRLTKGKFTVSALLGWNIIQLITIGARTRRPRTLPLMALFDQEKIILIASSFGRSQNPAWYYNLKAHPECSVQWNGILAQYVAREAEGNEYDTYWQWALASYEGYEKYKERAGRKIPVMVLEPKK